MQHVFSTSSLVFWFDSRGLGSFLGDGQGPGFRLPFPSPCPRPSPQQGCVNIVCEREPLLETAPFFRSGKQPRKLLLTSSAPWKPPAAHWMETAGCPGATLPACSPPLWRGVCWCGTTRTCSIQWRRRSSGQRSRRGSTGWSLWLPVLPRAAA